MECYLDNSATTRCAQEVVDKMNETFLIDYGNPSSLHKKGMLAEDYITKAANVISKTIKVTPGELIFTSGGTEADNLAIIGAAMGNRKKGMHLITTAIEHPAVEMPFQFLEEQGFTVTRLKVDRTGKISLEDLEKALTPDTILVSIMYVNNEIGTIEPVEKASELIHRLAPNAIFHVDAIQAYGKMRIYPKQLGIDLMSVSGHKIHGPKGIGFLYVKKGVRLIPQILGGGQQNGMRSGTDNVPGIAGLGEAARLCHDNLEEKQEHMRKLRYLLKTRLETIEGISFNGDNGACHILSVTFPFVRSEVLLHALEEKEIYVSAGSACSSHKKAVSRTLKEIGLSDEEADCTIRFSLADITTEEEIEYAVKEIQMLIPKLQKYTRR